MTCAFLWSNVFLYLIADAEGDVSHEEVEACLLGLFWRGRCLRQSIRSSLLGPVLRDSKLIKAGQCIYQSEWDAFVKAGQWNNNNNSNNQYSNFETFSSTLANKKMGGEKKGDKHDITGLTLLSTSFSFSVSWQKKKKKKTWNITHFKLTLIKKFCVSVSERSAVWNHVCPQTEHTVVRPFGPNTCYSTHVPIVII